MPLIDLPGGAELWLVDGTWYAVYQAPGTDVPMMFAFDRDGMLDEHTTSDPDADKTLTMSQARARGAQVFGSVAEIHLATEHPWDGFMSQIERDLDIMPWLEDPEVVAHYASAWLRGTSPNLERTDWWQSRTDQERRWLQEAAANPTQARQQLADNRRQVRDMLQEAGATNVTGNVANLIADNLTRGHWSESYAEQQMRRLSDPHAPGELDPELRRVMSEIGTGRDRRIIEDGDRAELENRIRQLLSNRLGEDNIGLHADGTREDPDARVSRLADQVLNAGSTEDALEEMRSVRWSVDRIATMQAGRPGGFTQTRNEEDTVRNELARWLGPVHGAWSAQEIAAWAGRLRNDPNARIELEEHLKGLRMAAFPNWTNENVTYEQIASNVRGQFRQLWERTPDETDPLFLRIAQMTDHGQAAAVLRREGWDRGIPSVVTDAVGGALQATGGQIRRAV